MCSAALDSSAAEDTEMFMCRRGCFLPGGPGPQEPMAVLFDARDFSLCFGLAVVLLVGISIIQTGIKMQRFRKSLGTFLQL